MRAAPATLRLLCALMVSGGWHVYAEEPPHPTVRVEVQMLKLPMKTAMRILPRLQNESTREKVVGELQEMVRNEKAELLGWPVVFIQEDRAMTECGEELRYPTEFESPQIPCGFNSSSIKNHIEVPTAFEVRETGTALEVEVDWQADPGMIQLQVHLKSTRLIGFQENRSSGTEFADYKMCIQPSFAVASTSSAIHVRPGVWNLLSTFVEQDPEPHLVLFLLRAKTTNPNQPHP